MFLENYNPFVKCKDIKPPERDYCIFFYNMLFDKAMSLFVWNGKPFEGENATMNKDYLEWCLFTSPLKSPKTKFVHNISFGNM